MLKCRECGFVIKCCFLECPKCGGDLMEVKPQPHYWDLEGCALVCENTHNTTVMPADIMQELPYCPFCHDELAKMPTEYRCRGDVPVVTREPVREYAQLTIDGHK